jgi:hypothetical protein
MGIADNVRFQRQSDFISQEQLAALTFEIIGAGAIGSAAALLLAKMGGRQITIWDPDKFEEHNLPNQMCRIKDIGRPKVEAVAEMVMDFEGIELTPRFEEFNGECQPNGYIITCVDSMKARKGIWEMVKKFPIRCIIDGRMGLTAMSLYTVVFPSAKMIELYEATLWTDEEVAPVRCTAKATIFTANFLASLICNNIITIMKGQKPVPSEINAEMLGPEMMVKDFQGKLVGGGDF